MTLVEIYVDDQKVTGEFVVQAFFEWNGQEWEMTVKATSKNEAEALAKSQSDTYLNEWTRD